MKSTKKIVSLVLAAVLLLSVFIIAPVSVSAATNPYDFYAKDSQGRWANCTWWAWKLAYDNTGVALPAWGNAGTWYNSAKNAGYNCNTTPSANSIVVKNTGTYGHVQFVTEVSGNQLYVKEGGYWGTSDGYHEGWTSTSGVIGYIHLSGNPDPTPTGSRTVVDGDYYITSALDNNKVLDIDDGKISNNKANAQLWDLEKGTNQVFTVRHIGDGYYNIICKKKRKVFRS